MSNATKVTDQAQSPRHANQRSSGGARVQSVPGATRGTESPRDRYGGWLAWCGIAGPILLALYFGIPALVPRLGSLVYSGSPTTERIVAVGADYHHLLTFGGWVQGTGALLCVLFLLGLRPDGPLRSGISNRARTYRVPGARSSPYHRPARATRDLYPPRGRDRGRLLAHRPGRRGYPRRNRRRRSPVRSARRLDPRGGHQRPPLLKVAPAVASQSR